MVKINEPKHTDCDHPICSIEPQFEEGLEPVCCACGEIGLEIMRNNRNFTVNDMIYITNEMSRHPQCKFWWMYQLLMVEDESKPYNL
jgi:hypothetical protein